MAINFTTEFTRLGKIGGILNSINTYRGTTVAAKIDTLSSQFDSADQDLRDALYANFAGYQDSGSRFTQYLRGLAQSVVIDAVADDNPQPDNSLATALTEWIVQMKAAVESVKTATVGCTYAAGGSNHGNAVLVLTTKTGNGLVAENAFAEDLVAIVTKDSQDGRSEGNETLTIQGEALATDTLGFAFPDGSGGSITVNAIDGGDSVSAGNLLNNGGFETFTTTDTPDNWYIQTGTISTTLKSTVTEIQDVQISGSPTGGTYKLVYTDASSNVQRTTALAYNASSADVQAALNLLVGLELVTVALQTGSAPNQTHRVTFTGVSGDVAILANVNNLTGGTPAFTHTEVTKGTGLVYKGGKALAIVGDGSQLTTIYQQFNSAAGTTSQLKPWTPYAVNFWTAWAAAIAAGVLQVALVDGTDTIINDEQGTANSFTVDLTAESTSFAAHSGVFRLPAKLPTIIRLRLKLTTAITNTKILYLDHLSMAKMTPLYDQGPSVAAFSGNSILIDADKFTITTANNRTTTANGAFQLLFERFFGMRALGLILPTNASPTQADSLIA